MRRPTAPLFLARAVYRKRRLRDAARLLPVLGMFLLLMPGLWRPGAALSGDLRGGVLMARRVSIVAVLALGLAYFRLSGGSTALAAIGLIAFAGMAQVLPALLGGIFWRGATKTGAVAGLITGFSVWAYTLFLPSFGEGNVISAHVFQFGLFGFDWLRPGALFGTEGMDSLMHSILWSLALNTGIFCAGSILSFPSPVERVQGAAFVNAFDAEASANRLGWSQGQAEPEALLNMAQRILGQDTAISYFETEAAVQGKAGFLPDLTPGFLAALERRLGGSVGAATAHAMIAQHVGSTTVTVEDLMALANEAAQIKEYSTQLEQQQDQLSRTARQFREVNEKLTQLSVQKDAFLSQISHELRTPMTSISAFSEILSEADLPPAEVAGYGRIIHDETTRLTRLLDDLLDLSVLENGSVQLNLGLANLGQIIDRALAASSQIRPDRTFDIRRKYPSEAIFLRTDADRLVQVFINLISNARKYCDAVQPVLRIAVQQKGGRVVIDFIDNGTGISKQSQGLVFEKFARLSDQTRINGAGGGGAGLGLAICREVMANLGGTVTYLPGQKGAAFRVMLPLRLENLPP